jgi:hypothetical protein
MVAKNRASLTLLRTLALEGGARVMGTTATEVIDGFACCVGNKSH